MSQFSTTIPALCPLSSWINTWNPITSVLPDQRTPLDLRPSRMDWFELSDSLIGCWDCSECIKTGKIKPGVNVDGVTVEETIGLSGRFWSIIDGAQDLSDPTTALLIALHAAWWCDDNGMTSASRDFRMSATLSARLIHQNGNRVCNLPGLDEVVMADLLRRSCNFSEVADVVMTGLGKAPVPLIEKALEFQAAKSATWDTLCYDFGLELIDRDFRMIPNKYNGMKEE